MKLDQHTANTMTQEAFDFLLSGYTASEIKEKMNMTDRQWRNMCQTDRFQDLIYTKQLVSSMVKCKEIENSLFALLEAPHSPYGNQRIAALTARYASFLV